MAERARKCTAKTRKGKPCKAAPLKPGTMIGGIRVSGRWCRQHDEDLPSSTKIHASRTREQMGGRPALPKPTEVMRRLIEENVTVVLRPHFLALGLDIQPDGSVQRLEGGALMYGESKDGVIVASGYEDLGAQIAAAEKLLDRVYGRPKQSTAITGPDGGPVELVDVRRDRAGEVGRVMQLAGVRPPGDA